MKSYAVSVDSYYSFNPIVFLIAAKTEPEAMAQAVKHRFGTKDSEFTNWVDKSIANHPTCHSVQQYFFNGDIGVSYPVEI